jgi:hypothetical protein
MELAIWIASGLGILALLGGLSASSALGLHLMRPNWSRGRRIFTAASFSALLPMSVAFAGLLLEGDVEETSEFLIAILALTVTTVILGILCLPAAWMLTRHAEAKDNGLPQIENDNDEQPLITG